MSTSNTSNFLRRTTVALAAVAALAISLDVSAQGSNALRKSTGETICTYSQLAVTPGGGIVVTCDGSPPVDPQQPVGNGGSFALSGPSSMGVGDTQFFTVTRSGGLVGNGLVNYVATGGCTPATGAMGFNDGIIVTNGFNLTAPSTATSCSITISSVGVAGVLGSPSQMSVQVTTSSTQPGCPTPPNDTLDFDLKLSGADRLQMTSGRIAAAVLPKVSDTRPIGASGQIIFGEATISPRAATVEVSVTKCRGVIDTNGGLCYSRLTNGSFMKLEWIEKPIWGGGTDAIANAYKLCKAYQSDGPFYVNVRYNYSPADCTWGGQCGYTDQWNYAAY